MQQLYVCVFTISHVYKVSVFIIFVSVFKVCVSIFTIFYRVAKVCVCVFTKFNVYYGSFN